MHGIWLVWLRGAAAILLLTGIPASGISGTEEFSFDVAEFEKKTLEWGGYAELKWDHIDFNQDGTLFQAGNDDKTGRSTLDRLTGSLQIDGSYIKDIFSLYWILKAAAQQDEFGWADMTDIYETYGHIKLSDNATASLGKKSYKWGKGYAWNPAGFVNRPKDPNNPEEALEGYVTFETDLVKSYSGPLQNAAFTTIVLPVWDDLNEEFGVEDNVNLAAKFYLLYQDTDIDLLFYTGNSRSTRVGVDFSKNLQTNFEIHGELAYISEQKKILLEDDGSINRQERSAVSGLVGLRYLSQNDITSIIEYYYNGGGYSSDELERFHRLVDAGMLQLSQASERSLLEKAEELSMAGYGKPYPGRNYLYAKFSQKEPFDILYFTPGITVIFNLDDLSAMITPEVVYTGFTNWEMRLRLSYLAGSALSEYGEKQNSSRLELRVRYFF